MKGYMTLGSYKDQDLEWLVINRQEGVVTLLCRHIIPIPCLVDEKPEGQDSRIKNWLNKRFLPELEKTTLPRITLVRQLREEEAKLLLSPDERCACLSDYDDTCSWWHLNSKDGKFKVVSENGAVCTRSVPYLAGVRPVIEVLLGE